MSYPHHITEGQRIIEPQIYFVAPDEKYVRPQLKVQMTYRFGMQRYTCSKSFPISERTFEADMRKAKAMRQSLRALCTEAVINRQTIDPLLIEHAYDLVANTAAKHQASERNAQARRGARNDVAAVWLKYGPVDHIAKSHYKQYQWIAS